MSDRITLNNAAKAVGAKGHETTLWEGVDFTVAAGEVVCITGPSGCGKSTLLNCLGLLEPFTEGQLAINGVDVTKASGRQRMRIRREELGYLFQDYALVDNETVAQNIQIAANPKTKHTVEEVLSTVGLQGKAKQQVFQLSGGEQQRVAMARILIRQPSIVLADEPTASLDRDNATVILGHLRQLADAGAVVSIVSHDPWVMDQCDRRKELSPHDKN